MDRIGLSSHLVRIARMLIIANIVDDFRAAMLKADPSIGMNTLDEMSDFVKSCSAKSKIQKLASYCLVKGFLKWPEGKQDFDTVVRLFGLVNDLNQNMIQSQDDYDKLAYPKKYLNDPDCKRYVALLYEQDARQERSIGGFNPDVEFKGKRYTDGVVTIYRLKDNPEEMQRVRRALDVAYGMDTNPWCLATRVEKKDPIFEPGSLNFEKAWEIWRRYSRSPKRIAFKGKKPVAFYADEQWWDMQDKSHIDLPVPGATDDQKFMNEMERFKELKNRMMTGCLTDDEIAELANYENWKIRMEIAGRKALSLPVNFSDEVRESIARRDGLSEDLIRKLAVDSNREVRAAIAKRKDLPDDLIRILAEDKEEYVRIRISEREGLPEDVIYKMVEERSWKIKENIFSNNKLSEEMMHRMASHENKNVRISFADYDNLPLEFLYEMANDENKSVRYEIAKKKDLPEELVVRFAQDDDHGVRLVIANREELSDELVRLLADDAYHIIREFIAQRKKLPDDVVCHLAGDKDCEVRRFISEKKGLTVDVLRMFSEDDDELVRKNVAKKKKLPVDIIRWLAKDDDWKIRTVIAKRKDLPEDIADQLKNDRSVHVRRAFARNHEG